MEPRFESHEHARLIAQLGWVQRLAASIVRDPSAAEDVAQDAAHIALARREPLDDSIGQRSVDGLRAWLAAVVRQVARNRASADASRRARERNVARDDAHEGEQEIVERSARARRVAEAVAQLDEPYRSTVLHRFFDELPMAQVARRTGVNEATARKRLERGLAILRERLDREFGARSEGWALALIDPASRLARHALPVSTVSGHGALVMSIKLAVFAGIVVSLVLVLWQRRPSPEIASATTNDGSPAVAHDREEVTSTSTMVATTSERDARASAVSSPERSLDAATGSIPDLHATPTSTAALHGAIFVDDERRAPHALNLAFEGCALEARVDGDTASWRSEPTANGRPRTAGKSRLWVTSEETVPVQLDLDAEDLARGATLDLRLSTGRRLELTFLDADTHAPLPHLPFFLTRRIELERTIKMNLSRGDELRLETDGMGRASARGLPFAGGATVCLEIALGSDSGDPTRVRAAPPQKGPVLWSIALEDVTPALIAQTIYTKAPLGEAHARGCVPDWARAGLSAGDTLDVVARDLASPVAVAPPFELAQDAAGCFELRGDAPCRHAIWLREQKSGRALSEVTEVEFKTAGEHTPIELRPASAESVQLHFVNVPAHGVVETSVYSKSLGYRKQRDECAGVSFDREVPLRSDDRVQLRCRLVETDPAAHEAGLQVSLQIDPARDREVTVDLAGTPRWVSIEAPSIEIRGDAWIALLRVKAGVADQDLVTRVLCKDGRGEMPVLVPSGRWLYVYYDGANAHAVFGVVDVTAAEENAPLVLRPELELRSRADVGKELVFSAIGGVSLEKLPEPFHHVRWKAAGERVAVPKDAKYSIIDR